METQIIDALLEPWRDTHRQHPLGPGDDAAEVAAGNTLVACDAMVENVHFDRSYCDIADIGWRALAANLSDIASMGGTPGPFLLALGVPRDFDLAEARALARGLRACVEAHDLDGSATLIGGDVVRSPCLSLTITLLGQRGPRRLERVAGPGDRLFVMDSLGDAAGGLALLQAHGASACRDHPALASAHLRPRAQTRLGAALAQVPVAVRLGCLDLSDGLARDAGRFRTLDAPLGAEISIAALPCSPALVRAADVLELDPWELAAAGGEDYKLCVAAPAEHARRLSGLARSLALELTEIGELTEAHGVRFVDDRGVRVPRGAFAHFPSGSPSPHRTREA